MFVILVIYEVKEKSFEKNIALDWAFFILKGFCRMSNSQELLDHFTQHLIKNHPDLSIKQIEDRIDIAKELILQAELQYGIVITL